MKSGYGDHDMETGWSRLEERGYRSLEKMPRPPLNLVAAMICGAAFVYYTRHDVSSDPLFGRGFYLVDIVSSSVFGFVMVLSFYLLYQRKRDGKPLSSWKTFFFLIVSILAADAAEQMWYRLLEQASSNTDLATYLQEKGIDITPGERLVIGDALGGFLALALCHFILYLVRRKATQGA